MMTQFQVFLVEQLIALINFNLISIWFEDQDGLRQLMEDLFWEIIHQSRLTMYRRSVSVLILLDLVALFCTIEYNILLGHSDWIGIE